MTPRSLADDLRGRTVDELAALLLARPDLMTPAPTEIAALAARATTPPSLSRCLDTLDAWDLHLLATTSALSTPTSTSLVAVAEAVTAGTVGTVGTVGTDSCASVETTIADLRRLRALALLWGPDQGLRAVTAIHDLVRPWGAPPGPPPPLVEVTSTWDPTGEHLDGRGGQAGREFVALVVDLLEDWGREPPTALRRGGIALRDVARTCERLQAPLPTTALVMETARAAGLLEHDDSGRWLPTTAFDSWRAGDTAQRWASLAVPWLDLPFLPSTRDERTLLTQPSGERMLIVPTRRALLQLLSEVPEGRGVGTTTLLATLDYRHPRRAGAGRERVVHASLAEARMLGLLVDDAIGRVGRTLITGDVSGAIMELRTSLPAEVDHVIVQADMTITVPGMLAPDLERSLRSFADVESRGPAVVARLTDDSISRAAAVGIPPHEILDILTHLSRTPLPQAVTYMLTDAQRRGIAIAVRAAQRSSAPPPAPVSIRTTNIGARARAIARALVSPGESHGDLVVDAPIVPPLSSASALAILRDALQDGRSAWIDVAQADGSRSTTLVDPIRLAAGTLTAFDHHEEHLRTFSVARIRGVSLAIAQAP